MKRVPIWKQSSRKHRDFGSVIRRHDRLLTFVGAIIIFSTFIVREGLREHLKDRLDSLKAAKDKFEQLQSIYAVGNMSKLSIEDYEGATKLPAIVVGQPSAANPKTEEERQSAEDSVEQLRFIHVTFMAFDNYVKDLEELSAGLPDQHYLDGLGEKILVEVDRETSLFRSLGSVSKQMIHKKERTPSENEILETYDKVMGSYGTLLMYFANYSDWVQSESEQEVKKAQWRYDVCTSLSYGLYALGWGLGLVGKFLGAGIAAE